MLSTPRAEVSSARGQEEPLRCGSQERVSDTCEDLLFPGVKTYIALKGFPMYPLFLTLLKEMNAVIIKEIRRS